MSRCQVVRVGDRVRFDGGEYQVAGLDGATVRLAAAGGRDGPSVVLLTHLLGAADFAVVSGAGLGARAGPGLLPGSVPPAVASRAAWWERHVVELLTELAPDAAAGTAVRPQYDPASVSLDTGDGQGPRVARGGRGRVVEHRAADAPPV